MIKKCALDLETACAVAGCTGKTCKHALLPHASRITVVGAVCEDGREWVFRGDSWKKGIRRWWKVQGPFKLVAHSGKFDFGQLAAKGVDYLAPHYWGDSACAANLSHTKVSEKFRRWYEARRRKLNEKLPKGQGHRAAKGNSLKVLAPYFLDVEPFWEDPTNHDDDDYVLADARYTLKLHAYYEKRLKKEGLWDFYRKRMMPDVRMLLDAEIKGVQTDVAGLAKLRKKTEREAREAERKIREMWAPALAAKQEQQFAALEDKYAAMAAAQITKGRDSEKVHNRYGELYKNARDKLTAEPINLNSSQQLRWILKEHFRLSIENALGEEGVTKAVLNKLARGREDVKLLLEYKEKQKLLDMYFPTYEALMDKNGVIHPTYHLENVRTGRTSCSNPNLQQVPPVLRPYVAVARPGMKFVDYDMTAIEAKLIAYFSEDPCLFRAVKTDFHGYNVTKIYFPGVITCKPADVKAKHKDERDFSKRLGYAGFYGAGRNRVQQVSWDMNYNWPQKRSQETIQNFRRHYKDWFEYKRDLDESAERGIPVLSLFGRTHKYSNPEDVYMKAANSQIQFAASELMLRAACAVRKYLRQQKINGTVLLLVHDEMVVEVEETRAAEVAAVVREELTREVLMTRHGRVELGCEGGITDRWEK